MNSEIRENNSCNKEVIILAKKKKNSISKHYQLKSSRKAEAILCLNKNNTNSNLKTRTDEIIIILSEQINLIKPRVLNILTKRVISRISKVLINQTLSISTVIVSPTTRIIIIHSYYSNSSITILTNPTTSNLILN